MEYGFVYAFANDAMPGLYKIGYTMQAPSQRAVGLTRDTGVLGRFEVAGFLEARDPKSVEKRIHDELAKYRTNDRREFFKVHPAHLLGVMRSHAVRYGSSPFVDVEIAAIAYEALGRKPWIKADLLRWEHESWAPDRIAAAINRHYEAERQPTLRLVEGIRR